MNLWLVLCTFPDLAQARKIAQVVVEAKLAACVNLIPQVESIYRWEGQMETSQEVQAVMKTTPERYPALEQQIRALHPYQVPEMIAIPVAQALPAYAAWVSQETSAG